MWVIRSKERALTQLSGRTPYTQARSLKRTHTRLQHCKKIRRCLSEETKQLSLRCVCPSGAMPAFQLDFSGHLPKIKKKNVTSLADLCYLTTFNFTQLYRHYVWGVSLRVSGARKARCLVRLFGHGAFFSPLSVEIVLW